jgi:polyphosphate kinase
MEVLVPETAIALTGPEAFINREISWLRFAGRVLELVGDPDLPLLEKVKFAGIMGMLHDEFFMKRMSGLKRQIKLGTRKLSLDGLTPQQEFDLCTDEILRQARVLDGHISAEIRPALRAAGLPILDYGELSAAQKSEMSDYFKQSVLPVLTPLAVDSEHPFPLISNLTLNLGSQIRETKRERFVRIKVPSNRERWVGLHDGSGFVPLEQVIAANLELLFPQGTIDDVHCFRVTRGAAGERQNVSPREDTDESMAPGSIISMVAEELKARKFAGVVRLEVDSRMPQELRSWLARQLQIEVPEIYESNAFLGISDLLKFHVEGHPELRDPEHKPVTHPRLKNVDACRPETMFEELRRGEVLLHHPYHSFDTSVLRFLECAAADPKALAIKLTIYRTSSQSPIIKALSDAALRGKQVAVLVEITARFDEAPNIAWGRILEDDGVHVSYGVEKLKTHVKLALVVREEEDGIRRYVHVGTGNYHTVTARHYEDLGILSCDKELSQDVAAVFNELTSGTPDDRYGRLLVAPRAMRERFRTLIRREAENAAAGRPSGIRAKMNQLQDPDLIRELYRASRAGVPIGLNVRGLCCLRAGVPGLSENIRVFSIVGRFLEHGRIYIFENAGSPEYFIGSADWMSRNLDNRVETIMPVEDARIKQELESIFHVLETDNYSSWNLQPDGTYLRSRPAPGEPARPSQQILMSLATGKPVPASTVKPEADSPSE